MKNVVKKIINSKIEKCKRVLVHALSLEIEKIKNKEDDKGSLINTIISKTLRKFKKKKQKSIETHSNYNPAKNYLKQLENQAAKETITIYHEVSQDIPVTEKTYNIRTSNRFELLAELNKDHNHRKKTIIEDEMIKSTEKKLLKKTKPQKEAEKPIHQAKTTI